jgi:hypothetical protein
MAKMGWVSVVTVAAAPCRMHMHADVQCLPLSVFVLLVIGCMGRVALVDAVPDVMITPDSHQWAVCG